MPSVRKKAPVRKITRPNKGIAPADDTFFFRAFHNSPAMQSIIRADTGQIVEVNDTFLRHMGATRDMVLGKTPLDLNMWVEPGQILTYRHLLETQGKVSGFEVKLRTVDGRFISVLLSSHPIMIDGVPHFMNAGVDITAEKRAEAELQRALAKERELHQLKSEFIALVSHEFRTPLEVILSSTDNLQRYHERLTPERRNNLLTTINRSVSRMTEMMEEVLMLGRLETGGLTCNPSSLDLPALCRRICDEIHSATNHRCPVRLTIENTLPPARADESLLRHILGNLLTNAIKYSPAGAEVLFTVTREAGTAVCQIADKGCGIPAADQKHLFEAFHRGSNVRQIPGTGLGLLIVKRSITLHAGEIHFQSTESLGTTFTARLPLWPG